MYSMLIVDDEAFAAKGICGGTDWSQLGIDQVFLAFSAEKARERFATDRIDVMICDIEMPDENGLELVEWVKKNYLDTEVVFLTCHSEFGYAKQAIHLGSFDYLLKPVDGEEISGVVRKMLANIKEKEEQRHFNEMYQKYKTMWNKQKPVLAERFWSDFLSRRILSFGDFLERALVDAELPLTLDDQVLVVLISIEEWRKPLNDRDQEIMEYAIKKATEELFLSSDQGHVVFDKSGLLYVLIYQIAETGASPSDKDWKAIAGQLIQAARDYFFSSLSCYIGQFVPFQELLTHCDGLRHMERNSLTASQSVISYKETTEKERGGQAVLPTEINISGWSQLMLNGKKDMMIQSIQQTVNQLEAARNVNSVVIDSLYHDVLQIIYHFLQVKGVGYNQVPNFSLWTSVQIRTLAQFKNWAINLISAVLDAAFFGKEDDDVIHKAISYMKEHLEEDISREDVAAFVFLNPAYLSRLFKRAMNQNLVDYLIDLKMGRAKELLDKTDLTVSRIAQQLGYVNFSHFAKTFKKRYGDNPQNYRNR